MKVSLQWSMRRRERVRVIVIIVVVEVLVGMIGIVGEIRGIIVVGIMIGREDLLGGIREIMIVIVVDAGMIILGGGMMTTLGGEMIVMKIVVGSAEGTVVLQEETAMMTTVVAGAAPAVLCTAGTVVQATLLDVAEHAMKIGEVAEDMTITAVVDVVLIVLEVKGSIARLGPGAAKGNFVQEIPEDTNRGMNRLLFDKELFDKNSVEVC